MVKWTLAVLLIVGIFFAATPSDVFADPPDTNAPATDVYGGEQDSGRDGVGQTIGKLVSTVRSLIYGPPFTVVCTQHTDNAHKSSETGRVNIHVDARCPVRVAEMFHRATLLRSNNPQYGYVPVQNLTGKRGTFHRFNVRSGRAVANHDCSRHWLKGTGAGFVRYKSVDSQAFAATSSPRPEFNPCRLP